MTAQATVAPPRAAPPRENRTPRSARIRSALADHGAAAGAGLWYLVLLVIPLTIVVLFSFGEPGPNGGYAGGFTLDNFATAWAFPDPFRTSLSLAASRDASCACSSGCRSPTSSRRGPAGARAC